MLWPHSLQEEDQERAGKDLNTNAEKEIGNKERESGKKNVSEVIVEEKNTR